MNRALLLPRRTRHRRAGHLLHEFRRCLRQGLSPLAAWRAALQSQRGAA